MRAPCRFKKRFFLALICFSLLLALPGPAGAAEVTPPPDVFPPVLRVSGAEKPVRLASLAVRTEIRGGFAESSLDMVFFNPNNRILEGELEFPLAPGQEISGLSLDIEGELRRGMPVAKTRGQEVFDDVARRNVDPALLEATRGNAYRVRVYPLPAQGSRRVVLRVMQPLTAQNGLLRYRLPLAYAGQLDSISIEAVVAAPGGEVRAQSGNLGLTLQRAGTLWRGQVEKKNFTPQGWLDIALPAPASLADSLTATRWQERLYFSGAAYLAVPEVKRNLPKLVTLLWDASGSGAGRDLAAEYDLLDKYFQALGTGEVRLVVLRDKAEAAQNFKVSNGNWSELKEALHGLVYDGASNLADWRPEAGCFEYLLFSDGVANYGPGEFPKLDKIQRLFAVNSGPTADYAALRRMAARGAVVDLAHETPAQGARKLLLEGAQLSVLGSSIAGVGEAALEPGSAYLVPPEVPGQGAVCRLAGWVKHGEAKTLLARLQLPDGTFKDIPLALPDWMSVEELTGEEAPMPARLWGRYRIAALEADYRANKMAISRLGEEFGIVSRETSLIVLETAEDYALYGVTPPAALKERVEALRRNRLDAGGERRLSDDALHAIWREKVAWWESSFPKKGQKPTKDDRERGQEQFVVSSPQRHAANEESSLDFATSAGSAASPGLAQPAPASPAAEAPRPAGKSSSSGSSVGITLRPWVSDAPYIARMKAAKDDELYAVYLDERPAYLNSSAFFIDVADRFFERDMRELGLRVLSNLAEMQLENRQILRMLAYRLMQAGEMALALPVLEQVRELAPYEPQSLRDLAQAQASLGNTQAAVDLLHETARRVWSGRFGEINTIALTEMNALIARSAKGQVNTRAIDSRLLKNLPSDIRVVLAWDMDNTDMDLWVHSPDGEAASYNNKLTRLGGRMSADCTQGYGPEEFMLKSAMPGKYRVEVNYYGSSRQTIAGEVTMMVTVQSKFGTPEQKEERLTLRLKNAKDKVKVAEFTVK